MAEGSAERVRRALEAAGLEIELKHYPASTRSAAEAAAAIGCELAQIVKSLVFRDLDGERPLLVLASGVNRVDEKKLEAAFGCRVGRADAAFVRATTGFAIGGVAPLGHLAPVPTLIDRDLLALDVLWAAAGTPNTVFRISAADLVAATGGRVVDVKSGT